MVALVQLRWILKPLNIAKEEINMQATTTLTMNNATECNAMQYTVVVDEIRLFGGQLEFSDGHAYCLVLWRTRTEKELRNTRFDT